MFGLIALSVLPTSVEAQAQPSYKPGGYHSPHLNQSDSWSHVFNVTGLSHYHCHPHPFMQGVVDVQEGASATPITIEIRGFKFVPDHVVVGVATNVTWINRDPTMHTVDESADPPVTTSEAQEATPGPGIFAFLASIAGILLVRRH